MAEQAARRMIEVDSIPMIGPDGNMRTLAEIEAAAIDYALNMCGSRQNAARALGIGRSTLYRKMYELMGTEPPGRQQSNDNP